jgi:hypothetical protein
MKRIIRRLAGTCLMVSVLPFIHAAQPAFALDSVDTPTAARSTATRADDSFHWGWLGAVGLIGLLGLTGMNRRSTETMNRTTAVRP